MICYKDMAFCSAVCENISCPRQYTLEVREGARKWWGVRRSNPDDGAPVALSDFSEGCPEYAKPTLSQ